MAIITPPLPTEDTTVYPNADYIFCFDDILPEWQVKWGEEQLEDFDWKYGQASYPGGSQFFGQILKDHSGNHKEPWPPIVNLLFQAFMRTQLHKQLPDAKYLETKKVIVNGQLPHTPASPHADTAASDMWTLVYHCSDTDGDNLFFQSDDSLTLKKQPVSADNFRDTNLTEIKRVPFKQGRCVLFPSWYIHQGLAPTTGWRITIAFHMLIRTSINQNRYITSVI